jgi:hypothetical protein
MAPWCATRGALWLGFWGWGGAEGAAVGAGGDAYCFVEVLTQGGAGGEADFACDSVYREIGGFEEVAGAEYALLDQPAAGAHADFIAEAAPCPSRRSCWAGMCRAR